VNENKVSFSLLFSSDRNDSLEASSDEAADTTSRTGVVTGDFYFSCRITVKLSDGKKLTRTE